MVLLLVAAFGCHPKVPGLAADTAGDVAVGPHLVADPPSVDFGDVARGTTSTVTLTLRNDGDEGVHVTGVSVGDAGGAFSVGVLPGDGVPPGAALDVAVSFAAGVPGDVVDTLTVTTDDPDAPTLAVPLSGLARGPVIAVDPTSWDFGAPTIGCTLAKTIRIENVGNADLEVSSLGWVTSGGDLGFVGVTVPMTLAPGESRDVEVDDAPLDTFADDAYLAVHSDDAVTPEVDVSLTGSGTFYDDQLDTFAADGSTSELDLTAVPVASTLEVRVDGLTLTKGWAWDSSTNAVDVVPAPKAGSTVEVRYDVQPPSCP